MFSPDAHRRQTAFGIIAVGVTIAISSFGIVRAQLANPDNGQVFRCHSGAACVEARSTGRGTFGVLGLSESDGVHGETSSVSGKAAEFLRFGHKNKICVKRS